MTQNLEYEQLICVFGDFNILHPGHIRFLKFAKEQGTYLWVGVFNKESSASAYISDEERIEALASLTVVDEVVVVNNDQLDWISRLRPYAVIKGKEYEKKINNELAILQSYGGKLLFGSGESTTANYLKTTNLSHSPAIHLPTKSIAYCQRHQLNATSLEQTIAQFSNLHVAVIGDTIIDEYIDCEPVGMSREDPTLVVSPLTTQSYLGGAGIVAAHAAALGATVDFYSVLGADKHANFVQEATDNYRVQAFLATDHSRPTTVKTRYRAQGKSLLRVNQYRQHDIYQPVREQLLQQLTQHIKQYDLIIFSDFNYGVLGNGFIQELITMGQQQKIPMVADSQSSSQIGDLHKFKGMKLVTPTEHETRMAINNRHDGLIQVSEQLGNIIHSDYVCVTLGEEGILIRSKAPNSSEWLTDEIPALNHNPIDIMGAGDAFFTATSLGLMVNNNIWESSLIGSFAAAVQVGQTGNIPVNQYDVLQAIQVLGHL